MNRRLLLESLLESKPQLATPTISLSDSILSIEEVENAEYYDIYVDGVLAHSIEVNPAPAGGTVTLTVTEYRTEGADEFKVYDGRDNTGTLLYDETSQLIGTQTLNCQSGYLYIEVIGLPTLYVYDVNTSSDISYEDAGSEEGLEKMLFTVNADGTISMTINWDD